MGKKVAVIDADLNSAMLMFILISIPRIPETGINRAMMPVILMHQADDGVAFSGVSVVCAPEVRNIAEYVTPKISKR